MNENHNAEIKKIKAKITKSGQHALWQNVKENSCLNYFCLSMIITGRIGERLTPYYVSQYENSLMPLERGYYVIRTKYSCENGKEDLRTKVYRIKELSMEDGKPIVQMYRCFRFFEGKWQQNVCLNKSHFSEEDSEDELWEDCIAPLAFLTQAISISQKNAKMMWNKEKGTNYFTPKVIR